MCDPDPERYLAEIAEYEQSEFDRVYVRQGWQDQAGCFDFMKREILPTHSLGSIDRSVEQVEDHMILDPYG